MLELEKIFQNSLETCLIKKNWLKTWKLLENTVKPLENYFSQKSV